MICCISLLCVHVENLTWNTVLNGELLMFDLPGFLSFDFGGLGVSPALEDLDPPQPGGPPGTFSIRSQQ